LAHTQVWEEQRLITRSDGGFIVELRCTNNAPKGDCFHALLQLCGAVHGRRACQLRISMTLCWHKQTLGKAIVQGGAESDARRSWGNLLTALQTYAASQGGLQKTENDCVVSTIKRDKSKLRCNLSPTVDGARCRRWAQADTVHQVLCAAIGAVYINPQDIVPFLLVLLLIAVIMLCCVAGSIAAELRTIAILLNTVLQEQS
jgi:hypothetical protein